VTTIDRHGAAIDADLHSEFGGLCLLDWFRGTYSWKHLFRLLGQLGTDSRWFKAQLMDPEVAGAWAKDALEREKRANAEGREPAPWRPPLADYTLTDELIVALINEIRGLRFQMSDGKRNVDPFPRPDTEFDRQLAAQRQQQEDEYMDRLMAWVEEGQQRWREEQGLT
jgi:hypothetical protein